MFDLLPLTSAPDLSPRRRRPAADLVERTPRRTAAHGGQTTLNLAVSLVDSGALNRLRVRPTASGCASSGRPSRPSAPPSSAGSPSRPWTASTSRRRRSASAPRSRSATPSLRTRVARLHSQPFCPRSSLSLARTATMAAMTTGSSRTAPGDGLGDQELPH
jgi:hypothetical protein